MACAAQSATVHSKYFFVYTVKFEHLGEGKYRIQTIACRQEFYWTLRPTDDEKEWNLSGQIKITSVITILLLNICKVYLVGGESNICVFFLFSATYHRRDRIRPRESFCVCCF